MDDDITTMLGQANGVNVIVKELVRRANDFLRRADDEETEPSSAEAGPMLSAMILAPFALELALKAVYFKQSGKRKLMTHHLSKLMKMVDELPGEMMGEIEHRFSRLCRARLSYFDKEPITAKQLLATWGDAFTKWRYLHEAPLSDIHYMEEAPILVDAIIAVSMPE